MIKEMQQLNPLSALQVSGKVDLGEAVMELFGDAKLLEARQMAATQAFHGLSSGIITNVWNLLNFHAFKHDLLESK
uniref:Uncharacterized protein n=1 Tax=Rhizophora mucronata TaxID=61149 RepID=A0A2P2JR42_RHIMU